MRVESDSGVGSESGCDTRQLGGGPRKECPFLEIDVDPRIFRGVIGNSYLDLFPNRRVDD